MVTRISAVVEDVFNHGGNFIFSNRPQRFESFRREQFDCTNFPHLHIMGSIIRPNQVLPVPAEFRRRSAPVPVRQALVVLLQNFPCQLRVRHHYVQRRPEPNRYDRTVLLGPLRVTSEPDRFHVVQVSDHRKRPWPWRELEPEAVVEVVGDEEKEEREKDERENHFIKNCYYFVFWGFFCEEFWSWGVRLIYDLQGKGVGGLKPLLLPYNLQVILYIYIYLYV